MRRNTTYVSLYVLPFAAAGCAGLIAYCGLYFRNQSSLESVLYPTIALFAVYTLLVLCATAARRTPWIGIVSVAAATVGLAGSLALILYNFRRENDPGPSVDYWERQRLLWTILGFGWLIGSTACFLGLVKGAQLNARYGVIRWLTISAFVGLSMVIALCLPGPAPLFIDERFAYQAIILLGSVAGLCLFTTLIAAHLTQLKNRRELMLDLGEISLECPRCGAAQRIAVGDSSCERCKLEFQITLRENLCKKCGYALYRLESCACPECGTPINLKERLE